MNHTLGHRLALFITFLSRITAAEGAGAFKVTFVGFNSVPERTYGVQLAGTYVSAKFSVERTGPGVASDVPVELELTLPPWVSHIPSGALSGWNGPLMKDRKVVYSRMGFPASSEETLIFRLMALEPGPRLGLSAAISVNKVKEADSGAITMPIEEMNDNHWLLTTGKFSWQPFALGSGNLASAFTSITLERKGEKPLTFQCYFRGYSDDDVLVDDPLETTMPATVEYAPGTPSLPWIRVARSDFQFPKLRHVTNGRSAKDGWIEMVALYDTYASFGPITRDEWGNRESPKMTFSGKFLLRRYDESGKLIGTFTPRTALQAEGYAALASLWDLSVAPFFKYFEVHSLTISRPPDSPPNVRVRYTYTPVQGPAFSDYEMTDLTLWVSPPRSTPERNFLLAGQDWRVLAATPNSAPGPQLVK